MENGVRETYFFHDRYWGEEVDEGPQVNPNPRWGWAARVPAVPDGHYGCYDVHGPFKKYDDAVSDWMTRRDG
jgi:hypothetical protein